MQTFSATRNHKINRHYSNSQTPKHFLYTVTIDNWIQCTSRSLRNVLEFMQKYPSDDVVITRKQTLFADGLASDQPTPHVIYSSVIGGC